MRKHYDTYFLLTIFFGLAILTFFMMKSFLIPFLLALILVHFFNPVYKAIFKKTKNKLLSSGIVCLLIALIIIIPAFIILFLTINEVQAAISNLIGNPNLFGKISNFINNLSSSPFFQSVYFEKTFSQDSISSTLKNFSQGFLTILQGAYSSVLQFIFTMFIMFFSLFYMFIDGDKFIKKITCLIPLQKKHGEALLHNLGSMIRATIKGTIVIAILQGIIGSILFWATGVASPLFLGVLMAIASVIPPVGSGLIWLPIGISMILLGHLTAGLTIILFGFIVIGTMDNVLRAKLVGSDTQMHPILILFSTLGGIAYFGISGFVIGPIIVSLFVSLWNIYALEIEA